MADCLVGHGKVADNRNWLLAEIYFSVLVCTNQVYCICTLNLSSEMTEKNMF